MANKHFSISGIANAINGLMLGLKGNIIKTKDSSTISVMNNANNANVNLEALRFISTQTTGTAPLSINSTTLNTNLNADLLDGIHSSGFATSTQTLTEMKAIVGVEGQISVCLETNTLYKYVDNYVAYPDDKYILITGNGGTSRWVGISGTYNYYTKDAFISIWKTDNTSTNSSNSNQVKLPLKYGGTYSFFVEWGDGTSDVITAYDDAKALHTYVSTGTYEITVTGICHTFGFEWWEANSDIKKILDIRRFGTKFQLANGGSFSQCSNLRISATDKLDCSNLTAVDYLFDGCTSYNDPITWLDTTNVTNMGYMLKGCSNFNQSVAHLNTKNVEYMNSTFDGCSKFNKPVPWDTRKVKDFSAMFYLCTDFNQDLSGLNIEAVTDANGFNITFLYGTSFSTANYDAMLISFAGQSYPSNKSLGVGGTKYSAGAAETARATLISAGWTIYDGGQV